MMFAFQAVWLFRGLGFTPLNLILTGNERVDVKLKGGKVTQNCGLLAV
jgi:hypothetical protein